MKKMLLLLAIGILNVIVSFAACVSPSGVTSSNVTATSATISWNSTGVGEEYAIRYRTYSPVVGAWSYISDITTTSRTITGLSPDVKYQVQVATECAPDNSINSGFRTTSQTFFTTLLSYACVSPGNFINTASTSSSASFTWSAISGTGVEYTIRYRTYSPFTGNWNYIYNISTTNYTVLGLTDGYRYQFQIATECSSDNAMNSGYGSSLFITLPLNYSCTTPSGLTNTDLTATTASFTWTPIPGTGVQYGMAYRQTFPSAGSWVFIQNIASPSYTITGLTPGYSYQIRITTECSLDNSTNSGYSTSLFISTLMDYACVSPSGFSVSNIGSSTADFTWNAIPGSGVEYTIRYRTHSPVVGAWSYANNISAINHTLTGLASGVRYQVQVATECALNNSINSGYGSSIFFYTLADFDCEAPVNLMATSVSEDEITYQWDPIIGTNVQYQFRYRDAETLTWTNFVDYASNSITVSGLQSGMLYLAQVKVECRLDNTLSSDYTQNDSTVTIYDVDCNSYLPLSYSVDSSSFSSARVSWEDSNPFGVYDLRFRTSTGSWSQNNGISGDSFDRTGLVSNRTYYTSIRLDCSNQYVELYSDWSDSLTFLTNACTTPSSFSDVVISNTEASISWNAIPNVDGYNVQVWPKSATVATYYYVPTNSLDLESLFPGTVYRYEVQTVCNLNDLARSPYSTSPVKNRNDFTTTGSSPCLPPTGFQITNSGEDFVELVWDAVPNTEYAVSHRTSYDITWYNSPTQTLNTYTYTNLLPAVLYRFRVVAICENGQLSSDWTPYVEITTSGSSLCDKPSGLAISNVTSVGCDYSWADEAAAESYRIRYRKSGTEAWSYITTLSNFYTFENLLASTSYQVQVSSLCSGELPYSNYSESRFFTTLSSSRMGLEYESDLDINVYPNPFITSFSIGDAGSGEAYDIDIYSADGMLIKQLREVNKNQEIYAADLTSGLYMVAVKLADGSVKNMKITKE